MPEAVIVSVARTPIGRAMKGSLKNERPDDLTAFIVDTALNKIPELDRNTVEDLILGCGQPAGEAGYNLGRIVAIQAGMPTVPGVTRSTSAISTGSTGSAAGCSTTSSSADATGARRAPPCPTEITASTTTCSARLSSTAQPSRRQRDR